MLQALKLDKVSRFAKDLSVLFSIPGLKIKITGLIRNKMFRNRPVSMLVSNDFPVTIRSCLNRYSNVYKHILSADR